MTRKLLFVELFFMAAAIIATALIGPHLPARVPTHWGLGGQPNGFSPRSALWFFGPGMLAATMALTSALPWLSPRRFEVSGFRSAYGFIMGCVFFLLAYIYGVMLWADSGHRLDIARAILGGVCLFFVVFGNVVSKVRRNFFIGVRTPWTLANERVWYATHRFAAKCFVAAGLVGMVLALAGVQFGPIAAVLAGALAPVIYSLVYYKHLEHSGEL